MLVPEQHCSKIRLRQSDCLRCIRPHTNRRSIENQTHFCHSSCKLYHLLKEYINAATTELEDRKQKQEDSVKLDPLGMWIGDIERYTPAEFYQDKSLYKDADGIGSYASRFIFRPLKNLLTGSKEIDKEFNLSDGE